VVSSQYKLFYRTRIVGCSTGLPDPVPPPATPPPAPNCFQPYTGKESPDLVAMTTTTTGLTVPYIVRVERGTMNRGIYDIAVLFDPTRAKPWTALAPQPQWNGKVVYSFGASTGQPRLQFRSEQNWADHSALSRGFMVVFAANRTRLFFIHGPTGYGVQSSSVRLRENEPLTGPLTEPARVSPAAAPSKTPSPGSSKWTFLPLTRTLSSVMELSRVLSRPSQTLLLSSASSTDTGSRIPSCWRNPCQRPCSASPPCGRGDTPAQAARTATNPIDNTVLISNPSLRRHIAAQS
jgi:hypothetical protein